VSIETSDRIPLSDIPINHQLQDRLAEAEERISRLNLAVTRTEVERDRASIDRDAARTSRDRIAAELLTVDSEAERLTVQREQLAITLAEILRGLDHPGRWPVGATEVGVWFALADVQRWRNVLNQHGGDINEDALRPTSPTGDPN
jgi:hypothetical protein